MEVNLVNEQATYLIGCKNAKTAFQIEFICIGNIFIKINQIIN